MIEIQNLKKAFGDRILFDDFNLTTNTGEMVIFSGASGSGKTTLFNMIGSLESVDDGLIVVDGLDIGKKRNQLRYFKEKVGFIFQNFVLIEDKTIRQNLEIIKKENRSDMSIENALAKVGLSDKLDSKVYTLSGGEQQRASLARLMVKKCDLVLADEPTGSLDKKNAEDVMNILIQMNKSGKTIIIVTHDESIKTKGERLIAL